MTKQTLPLIITALCLPGFSNITFAQAPSITSQPRSQIVLLGHAAAFEVQAEGAQPLFYQWRANDTNIPSATNASLCISTDACTRPGLFQLTVSNLEGVVQSSEVSLTIFTFTRTNSGFSHFLIYGPGLKQYRIDYVASLPAFDRWQPACTGAVPVNINTASAELLQKFPGVDEDCAHAIIMARAGPDGLEGTDDDTPFRSLQELGRVPGLHPEVIYTVQRYLTLREPTILGLSDPPAPPIFPPSGLIPAAQGIFPARYYRIVLLGDAFP